MADENKHTAPVEPGASDSQASAHESHGEHACHCHEEGEKSCDCGPGCDCGPACSCCGTRTRSPFILVAALVCIAIICYAIIAQKPAVPDETAVPLMPDAKSAVLVVDGSGCMLCQSMTESGKALQKSHGKKLNVIIHNRQTDPDRYAVKSAPAFLIVDSAGHVEQRQEGFIPLEQLQKMCDAAVLVSP